MALLPSASTPRRKRNSAVGALSQLNGILKRVRPLHKYLRLGVRLQAVDKKMQCYVIRQARGTKLKLHLLELGDKVRHSSGLTQCKQPVAQLHVLINVGEVILQPINQCGEVQPIKHIRVVLAK